MYALLRKYNPLVVVVELQHHIEVQQFAFATAHSLAASGDLPISLVLIPVDSSGPPYGPRPVPAVVASLLSRTGFQQGGVADADSGVGPN